MYSYIHSPLSVFEQEKRQAYDGHIWEVERACFSPLLFVATGSTDPTATATA